MCTINFGLFHTAFVQIIAIQKDERVDEGGTDDKNLVRLEGVESILHEQPNKEQLQENRWSTVGDMVQSMIQWVNSLWRTCIRGWGKLGWWWWGLKTQFHFKITKHDEHGRRYLTIQRAVPKENHVQYKGSFPTAICFSKVNWDFKPHKCFLSESMLYIHFQVEDEIISAWWLRIHWVTPDKEKIQTDIIKMSRGALGKEVHQTKNWRSCFG